VTETELVVVIGGLGIVDTIVTMMVDWFCKLIEVPMVMTVEEATTLMADVIEESRARVEDPTADADSITVNDWTTVEGPTMVDEKTRVEEGPTLEVTTVTTKEDEIPVSGAVAIHEHAEEIRDGK
jgi:hypothetical protein